MKLNVGCGRDILSGYENLDLYVEDARIRRIDIRKLPYDDCTVEHVLASDILEHFPRLEWPAVLAEWVRVLRPDGTITVRAPEMTILAEKLLSSRSNEEWDEWNRKLFGGQGDGHGDGAGQFHYTGFSSDYLRSHCERKLGLTYVQHTHAGYNFILTMRK
jgi:SAM-dependent methyltransferase